jgi:cation diffusion facilitator CzcD-associated flavoprotein CzcO
MRLLYRAVPGVQKLVRSALYLFREFLVIGLTRRRRLLKPVAKLARGHLHKQVRDPKLRAALTPDYTIGCKRILPSNKWYPALGKPNVELVTDGIAEVREHSIVSEDGTEREVDTIIFGTGFHVTDIPIADRVRGKDGRTLAETWDGSMAAYKGTTVAGYPNLFFLVGPNTGLGHTSIVFIIESQVTYVLDALRTMRARGATTLEVREDAQAAYNAEVDRMTEGTVWVTGGCTSYYIDRNGHNSALWPTYTWPFRRRLRRFDAAAYSLGTRVPSRGGEHEPAAAAHA